MNRRSSIAWSVAVLLPIVAFVASDGVPVRAQLAAPGVFDDTAEEQDAMRLLGEEKFVSARTTAEDVLDGRPNSLIGHYVLGMCLFQAEGSLARAMFHLGRARELYEATWSAEAQSNGAPTELHQQILYNTARLAGQMELYEYQIELLGYYDYLYEPDLIGERAWPLLQSGDSELAREFATTAANSRNTWQRSAGLNALCAVEGALMQRTPYFEACLAALEAARDEVAEREPGSEDTGGGIAVDAYNTTLAAMADFRFSEAEEFALEGVRRLEFTPANPWRLLLYLRLTEGRFDDAVAAAQSMLSWRARQPLYLRNQARAEGDAALATLFLTVGEASRAHTRLRFAMEQPDRRGMTSGDAEEASGHHALLLWASHAAQSETRNEEAAFYGWTSRFGRLFGRAGEYFAAVPTAEMLAAVMSSDKRIVATLQPYLRGGISEFTYWLVGDLIEVLGDGVFGAGLELARERDAAYPAATPYYDALEAELEAHRGDSEDALMLAQRALDELPATEIMLRARTSAIAAEAAMDEGRRDLALSMYTEVLRTDGGFIRRLGMSLPASVVAVGGGNASAAADAIARSPRFHSSDGAFVVRVDAVGDGIRACLNDHRGNQVRCAQVWPLPPPDPEPPPMATDDEAEEAAEEEADEPPPIHVRLAMEFHRQIFSARITSGRLDMQSLDGRNISESAVARDRLEGLIGENPH